MKKISFKDSNVKQTCIVEGIRTYKRNILKVWVI